MKANKNMDYFAQLLKQSEVVIKSIKLLERRMLNNIHLEEKNIKLQIAELEIIAEHNQTETTNYLIKEFLPPMNREDLIGIMNELTKLVYDIINNIRLWEQFRVTYIRFDSSKLMKAMAECYDIIHEVIKELQNFKKSTSVYMKILTTKKKMQQLQSLLLEIKYTLYKSSLDSKDMFLWIQVIEGISRIIIMYDILISSVEIAIIKNT